MALHDIPGRGLDPNVLRKGTAAVITNASLVQPSRKYVPELSPGLRNVVRELKTLKNGDSDESRLGVDSHGL